MSKKHPLRAGFSESGLPTPGQVERQTDEINETPKRLFSPEDLRQPDEPPKGMTRRGKKKLTTMMRPELRQQLERIATNRGITMAEVMDLVLTDFVEGLKKR